MKYAVVYTSQTGNTAQLADAIAAALPAGSCGYCGTPNPEAAAAEVIFAGFWTDKGSCDAAMAAFLAGLCDKPVFLFGTAGFGGDPAYFAQILERVAANLGPGCRVVGQYMCQGKMPMAVRARYAAMAQQEPEKFQPMLDNFDRALAHPDEADLAGAAAAVLACLP